jgi:hypothetical protein
MTDIPGVKGIDLIQMFISVAVAFLFLALSGLFGWLLLRMIAVDLTLFEATLLFAISLTTGSFFMVRAGTGGLPVWMTLSDIEDEIPEEDYVLSPPKRPRKRRNRR